MKALSLWQPWASAIAVGAKRIETRGWSTSYRGLIAIHAASTKKGLTLLAASFWREAGILADGRDLDDLPRGAIVAVATLADVIPFRSAAGVPGMTREEQMLGDYTPGRFAWILRDVRPLRFAAPCRGYQRLWELDPDVEGLGEVLP